MLNFVTKDHLTPYPMMDNYVQVNVGNAADKVLPAVLANQKTPASGAPEHGRKPGSNSPRPSEVRRTSRVSSERRPRLRPTLEAGGDVA